MTRNRRSVEKRLAELETRADADDDRVRVVVNGHGTGAVDDDALDDRDVFDCPDCGGCILCDLEGIDK